jgi:hypothetical protein
MARWATLFALLAVAAVALSETQPAVEDATKTEHAVKETAGGQASEAWVPAADGALMEVDDSVTEAELDTMLLQRDEQGRILPFVAAQVIRWAVPKIARWAFKEFGKEGECPRVPATRRCRRRALRPAQRCRAPPSGASRS